jgi:hypothetical protein
MKLVAIGVLAVAFAVSCDAPTIPGRDPSDVYAFDLPSQPPIVMRWPAGRTIRVFAVAGRDDPATQRLQAALDAGAAAWNTHAVFAEYRLERTHDVSLADVVLAWSDVILPVDTDACRPSLTQAVTTFCIDGLGTDSARVRPYPLRDGSPSQVRMIVLVLATEVDAVDRLVAHELGHVLGIGRHSDDTRDLMWRTDPQVARPSRRDAATMQVLYHTTPDITP